MRFMILIKSTPEKLIAQGGDWRFLNELKKEFRDGDEFGEPVSKNDNGKGKGKKGKKSKKDEPEKYDRDAVDDMDEEELEAQVERLRKLRRTHRKEITRLNRIHVIDLHNVAVARRHRDDWKRLYWEARADADKYRDRLREITRAVAGAPNASE